MWFLYVLVFVCLSLIAWEDLKFRSVRTVWFLILFLLLVLEQVRDLTGPELAWRYASNLGFLLVQFSLLQVYFMCKERRFFWLFDRYIGWGDVVFLLCIAGVWPLHGFLLFSIFSLVASLVLYLLFIRNKEDGVPLAGLQAICFMFTLVLESWEPINVYIRSY